MSKIAQYNPISSPILPLFARYAIPSILGLISIASATVVDGIFIGRYVGSEALASINIAFPVINLFFGIGIMVASGASVVCGKFIGEKEFSKAHEIYSKSLVLLSLFCLITSLLGILFIKDIFHIFNLPKGMEGYVSEYLRAWFPFATPAIIGFALSYFVRVDKQPNLVSISFIVAALSNILLDWLLIVQFHMGIQGAALATVISQSFIFFILLPHLLSKKTDLRFQHWKGSYKVVLKAIANGLSEFLNEVSGGIVTFVFSMIILKTMGVIGVTAYTIINYIYFTGAMFCYGVADSIQPLLSINLGAKKENRIQAILKTACITNFSIGIILIVLILSVPNLLIKVFLSGTEDQIEHIAVTYIHNFWPTFLFFGFNLVLSSYFTSMQKPIQSATIALSRTLIFPILFISTFPYIFGNTGIFISIPMAEMLTLVITIYFYKKYKLRIK